MLKIQNVTVFHSKNLIQISRGLKQIWVSIIQGGRIVVKLEGYDRYYFCPDTLQVFSRRSASEFKPLRQQMDGAKVFFMLYRNGISSRVYAWQILRDNCKGIETFGDDRSGEKLLKMVP